MKTDREKTVIKTSIISIMSNIVLAAFKAFIGFISHSIAIVNDAINNLSDALSSIITIIGTKLAGKAPDRKHPFGYGRIEYMTSLVVSSIVLYAGITAFLASIEKIITPEAPEYSTTTLIILIAGIFVKFILGLYVKKKGREVESDSLVASGTDAFNDAILSISVLASAVVYIFLKISLEAYVGAILSIIIVKSGLELIRDSISDVLGSRIDYDLARTIKKEILSEPEVRGVFDLILNDYGPDKYSGSVHIEVEDTLTVADIDKLSRRITKNISTKCGVLLHTVGVYSLNTKDKHIVKMQKDITKIVFSHKGILQMHGFYVDEKEKSISFDIIIDFDAKDGKAIYTKIFEEVKKKYRDYDLSITLDFDMSD